MTVAAQIVASIVALIIALIAALIVGLIVVAVRFVMAVLLARLMRRLPSVLDMRAIAIEEIKAAERRRAERCAEILSTAQELSRVRAKGRDQTSALATTPPLESQDAAA